jgi:SAM-dependent methyltransferase
VERIPPQVLLPPVGNRRLEFRNGPSLSGKGNLANVYVSIRCSSLTAMGAQVPVSGLPHRSDWEDPRFRAVLGEILPKTDVPTYSSHDWEMARVLMTLDALGLRRSDCRGLEVAAGTDPVMFALSRSVQEVVAVDRYDGKWRQSPRDFPTHPELFTELDFVPSRLRVLRMDGQRLAFRNNEFDFAYCIGPSVNWFGNFDAARTGVKEMARVVKPGGAVLVSVDFLVDGVDSTDRLSATLGQVELIRRSIRALRDLLGWSDEACFFDWTSINSELLQKIPVTPMGDLDPTPPDFLSDDETDRQSSDDSNRVGLVKIYRRPRSLTFRLLEPRSLAPFFLTLRKPPG